MTPYVGAGIGLANVDIEVIDDSAEALNLQAMAGASVDLGDSMALFAEARYRRIEGVEIRNELFGDETTADFNPDSVGFMVGLRASF